MIILGSKYRLTKFEKSRLKVVKEDIHYIDHDFSNSEYVIQEVKSRLDSLTQNRIVINTESEINPDIIKYLTNLQFDNDVRYCTMEHFLEFKLHKCCFSKKNDNIDFLDYIKPYSKWQYFQKRCIDYFGVFWLLFFSWPIIIYSYFKIKKQSPGKTFFVQPRIGRRSKKFECIKFRSMHEKTDYFNYYTQENDPRIFPYGDTMRKSRIDELPQILNIIKGEMHLIGPRAEWNELVEDYEQQIPFYKERHLVAPGITGWAQVNYPYGSNIEDTRQKLMYDLYYIKHWSIWLDLKIVWKTVMVVAGKKGI